MSGHAQHTAVSLPATGYEGLRSDLGKSFKSGSYFRLSRAQTGAICMRLIRVPDLDDVRAKLFTADRAPFLFVGAGLSRRYLRLDGWVDLLKRMANLVGRPYAYYATKANNDLAGIASLIAGDFHEIWWNSPDYASSRDEFGDSLTTLEGPLKVEVAKYTRNATVNIPDSGTPEGHELKMLSAAAIDGAITTNYDGLLERVFPEYHTYVGQDDLLFSSTQGVGEIYKIHGSASHPESLVLTSHDYDRFNERNPYLAAKLLTIFVEHPVLFLGYSLSDPNVTNILTSVARVLTTENLSRLQDHLFFVNWSRTRQPPSLVNTQIATQGFTIPVMQLTVPDFYDLFEILSAIPRKFPAQLLRRLKEHVYELVMSTSCSSQLAVIDIDDNTRAKDIDVVFGVGVTRRLGERGYQGLTREDLLRDVLAPSSEYDAVRVVRESLPNIMRFHAFTPIYRYLREASLLTKDGKLVSHANVDPKIMSRVAATQKDLGLGVQQKKKAVKIVQDAGNELSVVIDKNTVADALLAVLELPRSTLDLDLRRSFLHANVHALETPATASDWAKAVYLYDFLKFARV
jgi:SIR2-like domain